MCDSTKGCHAMKSQSCHEEPSVIFEKKAVKLKRHLCDVFVDEWTIQDTDTRVAVTVHETSIRTNVSEMV